MGVIVTEDYTLGNGLTLNSYYASLNTNSIIIQKDLNIKPNYVSKTYVYRIVCDFSVWISKEAKDSGKEPITVKHFITERKTPLTENLYEFLYTEFKKEHPSSVDA